MFGLEIPAQLCSSEALLPSYTRLGDAGLDLHATIDISLKPFERALIPTGLKVAIPQGYAGFVLPRSGLAIKHGLSLVNTPGLIDSNYRGEIQAIAINLDAQNSFTIHKGDRIAQLVIMRVENVVLSPNDRFEESRRGEAGFGSSGISVLPVSNQD